MKIFYICKTSHILPENCSSDIALTFLQQRQSVSSDSALLVYHSIFSTQGFSQ